ncbi:TonB-dependent receptor [Pseudoduganella sp. FT93W]|uniref:TonB-dependent receptor n=1 Tax=Duganella fentianensis TaxID=2692177 RepID=A0A845I122_9BURK|nr:TonB-dependent receptor [Duganella fentianensis]MYN45421.1 TonB-dependent receptor [Duganella fentianensis]
MQHQPQLRTLPLLLAAAFQLHAARADEAPVQQVEVTATALRNARIDLSPNVGTTVYSIDRHMIEQLAQGDNTPFNEVLLRLPGVSQDSRGSGALHVRDDHANVQYRINGVQLPESISGFGQSIDTRLVQSTDFITGALPAQYGLRTAGIVDIQTREGNIKGGGRIGVLAGSHDHVEPSAELFGTQGAVNYYLSGSYLANAQGIENPLPARTALHDETRQSKSFGTLSWFLDEQTRLGLMFGSYHGRFQIPDNPAQTPAFSLNGVSDAAAGSSTLASAQLDQQQRESNRFAVLSLQKSLGALNYQLSAYQQTSELHYLPDPLGDLVYTGVASDTLRSNRSSGLQFDASYQLNPQHTLRAGLAYNRQRSRSDNAVRVFDTDDSGAQLGTVPRLISDNSSMTGRTGSLYLQDEWHIATPLTLNYGLRYDKVAAYIHEQQWSPRLNLAYQLSKDTALHAGYSRYFTPPPQELAAQSSIDLYAGTSNAPEVAHSDPVRAERTRYYDVGLRHQLSADLTLTADAYYKKISNMLDEGQFGQALILTPFNYQTGYAKGVELSAIYDRSQWGGFLNLTAQQAKGRNIVSGQSLFGAAELAYIASHAIYVDHDQTYTVSGGAHYHWGASRLGADFLHGSGMRMTPDGGAPNSGTLPHYTTVNFSLSHEWRLAAASKLEARLALINAFDQVYLLRDGSGVGVGAPQYGARRSVYAGLSYSF